MRALLVCLILAGCGTSAPPAGPAPDLAIVERHPELLIGAWSFTITQSGTCVGGEAQKIELSGVMNIRPDDDETKVRTKPDSCLISWTVVGTTATLDPGQTCSGVGVDNGGEFTGTQTYRGGKIKTTDGESATYHDERHGTKERGSVVYESCDLVRDGVMTRTSR